MVFTEITSLPEKKKELGDKVAVADVEFLRDSKTR